MKRSGALRELSVDHHHALVLARRARRAAAGEGPRGVEEVWREVERRFAAELEPHFRVEETQLLPPLAALGEGQLVGRVASDHAALRALVAPAGGRGADELARLGALLERHVRFEERELFSTAQARLASVTLAAVGAYRRRGSALE